jgi:hypothetical protein
VYAGLEKQQSMQQETDLSLHQLKVRLIYLHFYHIPLLVAIHPTLFKHRLSNGLN